MLITHCYMFSDYVCPTDSENIHGLLLPVNQPDDRGHGIQISSFPEYRWLSMTAFVSRAERAFMDNAACVVGINSDCCEEFQFWLIFSPCFIAPSKRRFTLTGFNDALNFFKFCFYAVNIAKGLSITSEFCTEEKCQMQTECGWSRQQLWKEHIIN